ncbi:hypothetical protein F511_13703 [Dorcoceras hygrometricum]|uniref:Uncharacterized protein n=1 Tax=Dorcoceras hygrometricum TaxID=472368 RepID=A0A2Z7B4M4_9LAMI|nr:hypothetical protein F511_13703 [Dorcoceras hygrometricum]
MKNTGDAEEDQKRRSHIAIQCAKAAILLSSLKSDLNSNPPPLQVPSLSSVVVDCLSTMELSSICRYYFVDFQNEEMIEKLKIELIIERSKNKKLKFCIELELLLIFLWTLLLLMASKFL